MNLRLVRLLAFSGILLATPAFAQDAILANGHMTEGDKIPDGWSVSYKKAGVLELTRDTVIYKEGPASLSLRSVAGPATGAASHKLTLPGGPFTVTGFTKSAGADTKSKIALQIFGGGKGLAWIDLAAIQGERDWAPFSKEVTLPAGADAFQLVVTLDGEGQVWLDEVAFAEGSSPAPAAAPAVPVPVASTEVEALPVTVSLADSNLLYTGRFDFKNPEAPSCAWPASALGIKFKGTALNLKLGDNGENRWQIEVDGQPTTCLQTKKGEHLYSLAMGLAEGEHTVRIVKATESFFGVSHLLGFQLNQGGAVLPLPASDRRLEVIGDSISAGYGNEALHKEDKFLPTTENAYYTYGAIAAREMKADYACIAWSGKKMWPDNTIPELYDRILPAQADSSWDFAKWTPNVVVINLATNDFGKGIPDEAGWTGAYKAFIARVRKNYPQTEIYCAVGPMMGDWGAGKPLTVLRGYLAKVVADVQAGGDAKVRVIDFGTQDAKNGFGANWHPNVKTQKIMADQLAKALKQDLGW